MSKLHPGVHRVSKILNFLSDNGDRSFSYVEIAKQVNFSRSTCHMILTGLTDVGYITRLNDKSYSIGPVFNTISLVAARIFPSYCGNFQGKDAKEFNEMKNLCDMRRAP
ncbi:helix-turn-helix domain-containing protein [Novosphingobium sp. G106]|uniref:winged helix-turn-helix transcriptional regulator n=1 Tax=Novosphingobium sp. G106 TaxID=2849500 RepID=UPI001C2D11AA|nr:helix-turn-helix domain-containing protein [Novosphingobium sp. G106]